MTALWQTISAGVPLASNFPKLSTKIFDDNSMTTSRRCSMMMIENLKLAVNSPDQINERTHLARVEPRSRLVQQQHSRVCRQRPCQLQLTLQTVRQAFRSFFLVPFQPDYLEIVPAEVPHCLFAAALTRA